MRLVHWPLMAALEGRDLGDRPRVVVVLGRPECFESWPVFDAWGSHASSGQLSLSRCGARLVWVNAFMRPE